LFFVIRKTEKYYGMSVKLLEKGFLSGLKTLEYLILEKEKAEKKLPELYKHREDLNQKEKILKQELSKKAREIKGNLLPITKTLEQLEERKKSLKIIRKKLEDEREPLLIEREKLKNVLDSLIKERTIKEKDGKEAKVWPQKIFSFLESRKVDDELIALEQPITSYEGWLKENEEKVNTINDNLRVQYEDEIKVLDRQIRDCNNRIEKRMARDKEKIEPKIISIQRKIKSNQRRIEKEETKTKLPSTIGIGEHKIKIKGRPCKVAIRMPENYLSFLKFQDNEPQMVLGLLSFVDSTNIKIPDNEPRDPGWNASDKAKDSYRYSLEQFKKRVKKVNDKVEDQEVLVRNAFNASEFYIYKGNLYFFDGSDLHGQEEQKLLVKANYFRQEKKFQKLQKEIKLFEKLESNDISESQQSREPIPEEVRFAVWRRDSGKCVKCGSNENLEFDHIIPVSKGGSNTERNIQLLCEKCNREKSDKI